MSTIETLGSNQRRANEDEQKKIWDLWDINKIFGICVIRVLEGRRDGNTVNEIMAENISNMSKHINRHIQGAESNKDTL